MKNNTDCCPRIILPMHVHEKAWPMNKNVQANKALLLLEIQSWQCVFEAEVVCSSWASQEVTLYVLT